MSDGQTNWKKRIGSLRGHQGRNTTLLSLGVGSSFPFEAAQKFYALYHSSRNIPAVFLINKVTTAEFQRRFEEIEPYVFENCSRLMLETPQYLYPWSTTKESEVCEGMALVCPGKTIKLAGVHTPLRAEPQETLGENLKRLEQTWCFQTLMSPGQESHSQMANSRKAQQALEAIAVLEQRFEKVLSDPRQLAVLKNPLFRERLEKVADLTFYNLREADRANLMDSKAFLRTETLCETLSSRRRREAQKRYQTPEPVLLPLAKPAPSLDLRLASKTNAEQVQTSDISMEELFYLTLISLVFIFASWFPPTRYLTFVAVRFRMIGLHGSRMESDLHQGSVGRYVFYTLVFVAAAEQILESLLLKICSDWYMSNIVGYESISRDKY